jgi:hypothetical protein
MAVLQVLSAWGYGRIAHHLALVCGVKVHATRPPVQLVEVLQAIHALSQPWKVHVMLHVKGPSDMQHVILRCHFIWQITQQALKASALDADCAEAQDCVAVLCSPSRPTPLWGCIQWAPSPQNCPAGSCRTASHSCPAPPYIADHERSLS